MTGYDTLLMRLGVTPNYAGFFQTLFALELIQRNPDILQLVTKCLYPAVAKHFGTSWKAVERNIRSAAAIAWKCNPELIRRLAGYPLSARPRASQFMAILFRADPASLS